MVESRRGGCYQRSRLTSIERAGPAASSRSRRPRAGHSTTVRRRPRTRRRGAPRPGRDARGARAAARAGPAADPLRPHARRRRSPSSAAPRPSWRPTSRRTPSPGCACRPCGDAHLSNFGVFATPERRLVFDINDFDETLRRRGSGTSSAWRPASSSPAADNGADRRPRRAAARPRGASYRTSMRASPRAETLDVWYAHLDVEEMRGAHAGTQEPPRAERKRAAEGTHPHQPAGRRQAHREVDGELRFKNLPPLMVPLTRALEATRPSASAT